MSFARVNKPLLSCSIEFVDDREVDCLYELRRESSDIPSQRKLAKGGLQNVTTNILRFRKKQVLRADF